MSVNLLTNIVFYIVLSCLATVQSSRSLKRALRARDRLLETHRCLLHQASLTARWRGRPSWFVARRCAWSVNSLPCSRQWVGGVQVMVSSSVRRPGRRSRYLVAMASGSWQHVTRSLASAIRPVTPVSSSSERPHCWPLTFQNWFLRSHRISLLIAHSLSDTTVCCNSVIYIVNVS